MSAEPARDVAALRALGDLIVASARSPRQRERVVRAARLPLTGAGLIALREISRSGPIAASDVAKRLGVDMSTISRQLKQLDDHGLVERTVDDNDRRISWLTITADGRAALRRAEAVAENDFEVALADWSDDARAHLADLLERLLSSIREVRTDETGWSVRPAASRDAGQVST